jgi:hypothetical protein
LELFELAVRQRASVMEEPADKGGLPVIDVTDDDDSQLFQRRWGRCVHE